MKNMYRDPEYKNWLGWLGVSEKEEVCSIRACRRNEGLTVLSNCIQDDRGCFKLEKETICFKKCMLYILWKIN